MDELNNKGFDGENGTPYENSGKNRLEKGFDSEKGTPYEQWGGDPFGNNDFNNAENSTQSQFGNSLPQGDYQNIGQHETENGMPVKQFRNAENYQQYQPQGAYYGEPDGYPQTQPKKNSGLAIAALIISLINLLFFRSFLSFVSVPLCLILAIVSLAKKHTGKGFAITAIVVSTISLMIFLSAAAVVARIYPDFKYFAENQQQIVEDYKRDGTIPEQFSKYESPRFDKYWNAMGYDDFSGFFGWFIKEYERMSGQTYSGTTTEKTTKPDYPITA